MSELSLSHQETTQPFSNKESSVIGKNSSEPEINNQSLFDQLIDRSGGQFTGDKETIEKFKIVYEQLNDLAKSIVEAYIQICDKYTLNPGRVDLVLGGGRAKGKPFKADSDLDLFFYVENPKEALDTINLTKAEDPMDALDEKNMRMQELINKISILCKEKNINNFFHVMGYDGNKQEKYSDDNQLLLAQASARSPIST